MNTELKLYDINGIEQDHELSQLTGYNGCGYASLKEAIESNALWGATYAEAKACFEDELSAMSSQD